MEIFGIGGLEIALVIIIALVVAGPGRMAVWARTLGRWVAKMRQLWAITATQLQHELDNAGVDFKVPKDIPTRKALVDQLSRSSTVREFAKPVEELQSALKEGQNALLETQSDLRDVGRDVKAPRQTAPVKPPQYKPNPAPVPSEPPAEGFGTWGAGSGSDTGLSDDLGTWGAASDQKEKP